MSDPQPTSRFSTAPLAPGASPTAFLDGLRGLAALYVLIHHAYLVLHEGYSKGYALHPELYTLVGKGSLFFSRFFRAGHEAVMFFFVLSGFVIHLRYARRLQRDGAEARFDWLDFIRRRAVRLYPTLLIALLLTYALDRLGLWLGYAVYSGSTSYDVINNYQPDHRLSTLVGNLAFVMQTYTPVWGSDGPLWSLKYEWWFYMLYPFAFLGHRRSARATALGLAILGAVCFWTDVLPIRLLDDVLALMFIWWIGVLLADAYVGRTTWLRLEWLRWGTLLLPLLLVAKVLNHDLSMVLWALGFAGLLAAGLTFDPARSRSLQGLARLSWLGEMSYTLYVCHMPILVLLCGYAMSRSATGALPRTFGWTALGIVASMLVSWLLHLVGERPFLRAHIARTTPAPAQGDTVV